MKVMRKVNRLGVVALAGLVVGALAGCAGGGDGTGNRNSNSGAMTPGGSTGGGTFTASFSNARSTNADTSTFSNPSIVQTAVGTGTFKILSVSATKIVNTSGTRIISLTVDTNNLAAGKSYSLDPTTPDGSNFATLGYTETAGTATPKVWTPSGGSIVIDSISGKTYKLRIVNATMVKDDSNDSAATGSFTLTGSGTVTAQ